MEQTEQKKKITFKTIIGIIIGIATYILIQQLFLKPQSFDKTMLAAASELNKSCPIMADKETRMDNAVALPDNVFQYNYTLINVLKGNVDIKSIQSILEPRIVNNVKTNPAFKTFRDNNVTMSFSYNDKKGNFLFKILVTPEQYSTQK